MFISWRRQAITTDRPVEVLHRYTTAPLTGDGGEVLRGGRRKDRGADVPAWRRRPILCPHVGPGRLTQTPLLIHSERVGGLPRQRLLGRLPAIRSCCAADPFLRAAWWQAIEEEIDFWEEDDDGLVARLWARDRRAILAKLRQVVPRPSKAGVEAFEAYRREREAEAAREEEQWQEAWRRREEERQQAEDRQRDEERQREELRLQEERKREELRLHEERQREELRLHEERESEELRLHEERESEELRLHEERESEELRLHEERQREEERLRREAEWRREADRLRREADRLRREREREEAARSRRASTGGGRGGMNWRIVLGLPPSATLAQAKARYRELALLHHPDRSGDADDFARINDALERATEELG